LAICDRSSFGYDCLGARGNRDSDHAPHNGYDHNNYNHHTESDEHDEYDEYDGSCDHNERRVEHDPSDPDF